MKRYMNFALLYAILAMIGGVFYREFTKFNGFTAQTTLSVVHTHYFLLGMVFFLLLLVLEKSLSFTRAKTGRVLAVYHIGLNLTAVMFVVRGVTQVLGLPLSSGMDAAISGMAGIGHILLGVWCLSYYKSGAACRHLQNEIRRGAGTADTVSAPRFLHMSFPDHLPNQLIVLRRCMPVHPGTSGNGAHICFIGMEA